MAESEVTVRIRADVTPALEALRALRLATRTVLAALETALDSLEELQGGTPTAADETKWRCPRCGHPEYTAGPRAAGRWYFRVCARCEYVSRDVTVQRVGKSDG